MMMRTLLLFLARLEGFKRFMLHFKFFRDTAWRFVAGETLDDAVRAVREANRAGISATLDLLGENTQSRDDATNATQQLMSILDRIRAEGVDCNVSVKLTQLGLDLDTEFCQRNLRRIVARAAEHGIFVRVDMESSQYTERTLQIVLCVRKELDNVGAVIQAYLRRSAEDVGRLLEYKTRIRLCKGAYLEPPNVAFPQKKDTDRNFVELMKRLLDSGIYHAIATHDPTMIRATQDYAAARGIAPDRYEFQMLYGVRRDLQNTLARQGRRVRVYIPFGGRWYPYFMRRLAERPANVLFVVRNMLRG